ncbi:hypothetical protein PENTCL1PPCAC_19889, partial [Pristionchus entomophagus]
KSTAYTGRCGVGSFIFFSTISPSSSSIASVGALISICSSPWINTLCSRVSSRRIITRRSLPELVDNALDGPRCVSDP